MLGVEDPVSSELKLMAITEYELGKNSGSVAIVMMSGTATWNIACDFVESGDGAKTTPQFMPISVAGSEEKLAETVLPGTLWPETVLVKQSPALLALNCSVVGTEVSTGELP